MRALRLLVPGSIAVVMVLSLPSSPQARSQQSLDPAPERLAEREWYQDARFGLFVHWGVYSLLGQGEWVMQNQKLSVPAYEWLASTFDPVKFDARAWVDIAKAAGMRYITITARHHDGFSMFDTRATPYNIVTWTRFKRDPMKELAAECRRQGLKLFFFGANLLLNVGPRPDGTIQPEAVERLHEIGRWLQAYGSSIYGTRRGPVTPQPWGVTTQKGDVVYVHVLDSSVNEITLPPLGRKIGRATLMGSRESVAVSERSTGLTITLPAAGPGDLDRVVMLQPGGVARGPSPR